MAVLYFFQDIRNPFLDFFMAAITRLGEETVLVVLALLFLWCFDKHEGYYLLTVSFAGLLVNQFLKILCRVPRPWVRDPAFTIVEEAREAATGYSFPSGHTQTSVGAYSALGLWNKQKWFRGIMIALCVLVPVSRLYLGVHTLSDVLISAVIALSLSFLLYPLFRRLKEKPHLMYIPLAVLFAVGVAFLLYVELYTFPSDVDAHNLASAVENAYKLLGSVLGFALLYFLDSRFFNYETRAPLLAQLIKIIVGAAIVLGIKSLLKQPLLSLCGGHGVANAVRYFLLFGVAGVCPLLFPYFTRCALFVQRRIKKEKSR